MAKKKSIPAVYVEWEDSQTSYNWRKFDPRQDREPAIIHSVGILIDDYKGSVSISTSQSQNGNCVDFLTIPRSAIRKMKRLRVNG